MGSKRHVTLSIDSELLDQIKSRTENLSKLTEELYSVWLSVYSEKLEQVKGELQQELKSKLKETIADERLERFIESYREYEAKNWFGIPSLKEKWISETCQRLNLSREKLLELIQNSTKK